MSSSEAKPTALASISLNIFARSVFKFSFVLAVFTIFSKSWLGKIKNPLSSTVPGLKSSFASWSEILP